MLILISDAFDASLADKLSVFGEVTNDKQRLSEANVVLLRSKTVCTKEYIEQVPNLKLIIRVGVGIDNIDKEFAESKGIIVRNTPKSSSIAVAELVMAHLISAPTHIIEYHNGDIINEQHYKFKQEWVAKRAFFLTVKKQYALYLVASEGNLVDKTDYKGLEVERSDYPSLTKQYLDEILKYILKTEEVDFNYIKEFKLEKEQYIKRLILEGNPIVAKPASWSKKLENYKVVPSQVHAMILWNKTMYEYFNSGSKGYLFDISGLVFENFKNMTDSTIQEINQMVLKQKNSVCIPREVDKLPDGFVVNVNSMLEFAWNTRISRITDSLFRNVKSDIEESILKF
jgi:hypothetical protein